MSPQPRMVEQTGPSACIATYDVHDLIRDGVQVHLVLNDQTYTLRITRAGKLILTK